MHRVHQKNNDIDEIQIPMKETMNLLWNDNTEKKHIDEMQKVSTNWVIYHLSIDKKDHMYNLKKSEYK